MDEKEFSVDSLWLHEPESAELNRSVLFGHLCSCDNVCVAVVDETMS